MDLQQVAMTSFVLLQDEWSVVKGLESIETLKMAHPTHVIVHHSDKSDDYYIFSIQETLDLLNRAPNTSSLRIALNLQRANATPALEGTSNAESAPDRCIILADGLLVGFFDASTPPSLNTKRGGGKATTTILESANRSLLAEFPEQVALGETVSLLVSLSAVPAEDGALAITLPLGASMDIVVQARRGFVLEGKTEGSLVVTDTHETLPIQFKLRGAALGPGQIRVLALHDGIALGAMTLTPTVIEATANATTAGASSHEQVLAPVSVRLPDLSLLIVETQVNGMPGFTLWLNSQNPALALTWKKFGPIVLRSDPRPYFQEFYKDIENYPMATPAERAVAAQKLAGKGDLLFSMLFPPEVQSLLWSLKDRIKSVLVQSEEPWIPWELCKLSGRENGRVVAGPFLCEAFTVTRWLPGIGLKPTLKLQNIAVVVPSDSGLPLASTELDYLLSLAQDNRQITRIPARFLDVQSALASGEYDGWHFTGHGGYRSPDPNRSAMYLENEETFTPENIVGVVTNLGNAQPLVFLNACQIGRGGMSLTDIGGWARQFLYAGASAFIGAYWSVYDQPACDFAKEVYNRLLAGLSIGKAVQEARLAIKAMSDPTWLAYTVFADPFATVQT
jgi:CHAT domain